MFGMSAKDRLALFEKKSTSDTKKGGSGGPKKIGKLNVGGGKDKKDSSSDKAGVKSSKKEAKVEEGKGSVANGVALPVREGEDTEVGSAKVDQGTAKVDQGAGGDHKKAEEKKEVKSNKVGKEKADKRGQGADSTVEGKNKLSAKAKPDQQSNVAADKEEQSLNKKTEVLEKADGKESTDKTKESAEASKDTGSVPKGKVHVDTDKAGDLKLPGLKQDKKDHKPLETKGKETRPWGVKKRETEPKDQGENLKDQRPSELKVKGNVGKDKPKEAPKVSKENSKSFEEKTVKSDGKGQLTEGKVGESKRDRKEGPKDGKGKTPEAKAEPKEVKGKAQKSSEAVVEEKKGVKEAEGKLRKPGVKGKEEFKESRELAKKKESKEQPGDTKQEDTKEDTVEPKAKGSEVKAPKDKVGTLEAGAKDKPSESKQDLKGVKDKPTELKEESKDKIGESEVAAKDSKRDKVTEAKGKPSQLKEEFKDTQDKAGKPVVDTRDKAAEAKEEVKDTEDKPTEARNKPSESKEEFKDTKVKVDEPKAEARDKPVESKEEAKDTKDKGGKLKEEVPQTKGKPSEPKEVEDTKEKPKEPKIEVKANRTPPKEEAKDTKEQPVKAEEGPSSIKDKPAESLQEPKDTKGNPAQPKEEVKDKLSDLEVAAKVVEDKPTEPEPQLAVRDTTAQAREAKGEPKDICVESVDSAEPTESHKVGVTDCKEDKLPSGEPEATDTSTQLPAEEVTEQETVGVPVEPIGEPKSTEDTSSEVKSETPSQEIEAQQAEVEGEKPKTSGTIVSDDKVDESERKVKETKDQPREPRAEEKHLAAEGTTDKTEAKGIDSTDRPETVGKVSEAKQEQEAVEPLKPVRREAVDQQEVPEKTAKPLSGGSEESKAAEEVESLDSKTAAHPGEPPAVIKDSTTEAEGQKIAVSLEEKQVQDTEEGAGTESEAAMDKTEPQAMSVENIPPESITFRAGPTDTGIQAEIEELEPSEIQPELIVEKPQQDATESIERDLKPETKETGPAEVLEQSLGDELQKKMDVEILPPEEIAVVEKKVVATEEASATSRTGEKPSAKPTETCREEVTEIAFTTLSDAVESEVDAKVDDLDLSAELAANIKNTEEVEKVEGRVEKEGDVEETAVLSEGHEREADADIEDLETGVETQVTEEVVEEKKALPESDVKPSPVFKPIPEEFYDTLFYFSGMGTVVGSALAKGVYVPHRATKTALDVECIETYESEKDDEIMKETKTIRTARHQASDLSEELKKLQSLLGGLPTFMDTKTTHTQKMGPRGIDSTVHAKYHAFQPVGKLRRGPDVPPLKLGGSSGSSAFRSRPGGPPQSGSSVTSLPASKPAPTNEAQVKATIPETSSVRVQPGHAPKPMTSSVPVQSKPQQPAPKPAPEPVTTSVPAQTKPRGTPPPPPPEPTTSSVSAQPKQEHAATSAPPPPPPVPKPMTSVPVQPTLQDTAPPPPPPPPPPKAMMSSIPVQSKPQTMPPAPRQPVTSSVPVLPKLQSAPAGPPAVPILPSTEFKPISPGDQRSNKENYLPWGQPTVTTAITSAISTAMSNGPTSEVYKSKPLAPLENQPKQGGARPFGEYMPDPKMAVPGGPWQERYGTTKTARVDVSPPKPYEPTGQIPSGLKPWELSRMRGLEARGFQFSHKAPKSGADHSDSFYHGSTTLEGEGEGVERVGYVPYLVSRRSQSTDREKKTVTAQREIHGEPHVYSEEGQALPYSDV